MARVFLDTSVLAYAYDQADPTKRQQALRKLRESHTFVVSTQVMLELFAVLTRKLVPQVPASEAKEALRVLAGFQVVTADASLVLKAVDLTTGHQVSIWDAMILQAAVEAGCTQLWTEDLQGGSMLAGVRVVNPFAG